MFEVSQGKGQPVEVGRTIAVNAFVMIELAYLFNCRTLTRFAGSVGWFANRYLLLGVTTMLALQLLYTYTPVMNSLFDSAPLSATDWAHILAAALLTFLVVEVEKAIHAHISHQAPPSGGGGDTSRSRCRGRAHHALDGPARRHRVRRAVRMVTWTFPRRCCREWGSGMSSRPRPGLGSV